MRALLLAAGRGTRISRYLNGNPKCTVKISNDISLIQYTVNQLKKHGVEDIAVVTGYRHYVVEQVLQNQKIKWFYNPFFDVTNSIASAWFAKSFIQNDDIIIMNADVFCEECLYDELLSVKQSPVVFYDSSRIVDADYRFYCENNEVKKYGKDLSVEETSGEYVGIARFDSSFIPLFLEQLDQMIGQQQHSLWWENVLYSKSAQVPLNAYDVSGKFWAEVDYVEDYRRIIDFVENVRN